MAVYMDTDAVQKIADGFEKASDVLQTVSRVMEALMNTLRTTAFMGFVGGMAYERYLASLKPRIDYLAEYCEEIHRDLEEAIEHFINGDEEGASRFY
jgi:flagellar biosynthesis chaperone FliJ